MLKKYLAIFSYWRRWFSLAFCWFANRVTIIAVHPVTLPWRLLASTFHLWRKYLDISTGYCRIFYIQGPILRVSVKSRPFLDQFWEMTIFWELWNFTKWFVTSAPAIWIIWTSQLFDFTTLPLCYSFPENFSRAGTMMDDWRWYVATKQ